ncbi:hypothetical protein RUM43_007049 [Polyplax serrata]|uniref:Uncharacterized protein n=1 Tax=Polyplax serrata TaxID=468196 RepID=A0AAN8P832_POLSC
MLKLMQRTLQCTKVVVAVIAAAEKVIIDDVDDERLHPALDNDSVHKSKTETTDTENAPSRENPLARIKRFQVEAESRKIEFARLLEEHAQVIRQLKQMEETESSHHFATSMANVSKA